MTLKIGTLRVRGTPAMLTAARRAWLVNLAGWVAAGVFTLGGCL